jgi:hypothetical protein
MASNGINVNNAIRRQQRAARKRTEMWGAAAVGGPRGSALFMPSPDIDINKLFHEPYESGPGLLHPPTMGPKETQPPLGAEIDTIPSIQRKKRI